MPEDSGEAQPLGWNAIDDALRPVYGDVEPLHWGVILPYALGGNDPIQGTSAYRSDRQRHHLHYVTYGFSELYEKEWDDPEVSGFGFELTFRLACEPDDTPPNWALNFLQNLGRYVFESGNRFGVGHTMPLNGPIAVDEDTLVHAIAFTLDPELGRIETPNGAVEFLQIVGLTVDELDAIESWNSSRFLELVRERNGLLLTDLARKSYTDDRGFRSEVDRLTAAEGASAEGLFSRNARIAFDDESCLLTLGAILSRSLPKRLRGRIPYGRPFALYMEDGDIRFEPGESLTWRQDGDTIVLTLTAEQSRTLSELAARRSGRYTAPDLPGLTVVIERTEIKDNEGNVVDVIE